MTRIAVLTTLVVMCWVVALPRSSGPDEPGHVVRSGGVVRGDLDGVPFANPATGFDRGFDLPGHVGYPEPGCFAFAPDTPATCSVDVPIPAGTVNLGTRSAAYPIWGHLLPGVGTFAPPELSAYAARVLDAIVPLGIATASFTLARRRGALAGASTLLAATPMVWFVFAVVNPSGLVVAGGLGLWTSLLAGPPARGADRLAGWLAGMSWAALALPRRDGLIWAVLGLALGLLVTQRGGGDWWRSLRRGPQVLVVASTAATLVWAAQTETTGAMALFAAPLVPIGAVLARRAWFGLPASRPVRTAAVAGAVVGAAVVSFGVMTQRGSGFVGLHLRRTIGQTGSDLTEVFGVLGWLDTSVPATAFFAWLVAVGVLVGANLLDDRRDLLLGAAGIVAVGIVASWTLTMLQNDPNGTYWQGRYYLPLLVGVPLVLGAVRLDEAASRRLATGLVVVATVVTNMALFAAMRRFGVGASGSMLPWDWNTPATPIAPVVIIPVHVLATVGLAWVLGVRRSAEPVS